MKTTTQKLTFLFIFSLVAFVVTAQSPALKLQSANNNFIQWNDSSPLIASNPDFTVEMWVKAFIVTGSASGTRMIYCEGNSTSNTNMFRLYSSSVTGKIYVRPNGVSADEFTSTSVVFPGSSGTPAWHHIAMVGSTPGGLGTLTTLQLYVDGVLETTSTYTKTLGVNPRDLSVVGNLTSAASQTTDNAYNGEIDELRLWSRALTASEISTNMCVVSGATGLVRNVKFNEGSGTTVKDNVTGTSVAILGTSAAVWTTNSNCPALSVKDNLLNENLLIYPNPVNDVLLVSNSDLNIQIKNISIFDITGKIIYVSKVLKPIDVSGFAPGTYVFKVESQEGGVLCKNFIIN